ncbi:hypothetical protein [Paraburkholderia sediminicola]|uniref:hypothetical protein n=1 Tax=Paraburkholderia sediminicola TaxID=458836 RepID=UPI0038B6BDB9
MSDAYEFESDCLKEACWDSERAAYRLAGVDPDWHEHDEQEGHTFGFLPGGWSNGNTRNADNILAALGQWRVLTDEALKFGQVKTGNPREWIEWAIARGLTPEWLDAAYRDPAMHAFLPPPEIEPAMQKLFNPTNTPREERDIAWYVGWVKEQIYASVDCDDRDTWTDDTKSKAVQALLLKTFPELRGGRARSIDKEARPAWMKGGGRPRGKA